MYRKARAKALVIQNYVDRHRSLNNLANLLCEDGFDCRRHAYCAGVMDCISYMRGC